MRNGCETVQQIPQHSTATDLEDKFTMANRLAKEKSPYLLQHAHNPVDWYPWSEEAFSRAAAENKPIFLSIGYSTCHWCHVMERESFEDQEVARLLNDTFICIKVDREERPDIDNIYMTVCTMMTGSGGWPLTIIMTPDKKPFFAGTYFARQTRHGRLGMLDMIPRLGEIWRTRHDEVLQSTDKILAILQQQNKSSPGSDLDREILQHAFTELAGRYDSLNAGFSGAPKFPTPHNISFLLRYWKNTGQDQALTMAEQTLSAMRLGGIFDHVGFGFHRYATDEKWLLPHFEKMLYDQALLAIAYLEAYQVTNNSLYRQTADEIFTYVLRDLLSPENGFYSAEDADSEGVEGKFYVWTIKELQSALAPDDADFMQRLYNIKPEGNFHDEASNTLTGGNIFHLTKSLTAFAAESGEKPEKFLARHERLRQKLFARREERIHPHKDDKILTDWNGLMIAALALGARILDNKTYLKCAESAARFILTDMRHGAKFLHRYRDGESAVDGMLCDYAYVVWGLLELYAANFDAEILAEAIFWNQRLLELFWDDQNGGFFLTPQDGESLLVRPKEIYDGALPSGNSIALHNLLRLERITADTSLGEKARLLVRAFSRTLQDTPSGYTQFLAGLSFALSPTTEVVIVGNPQVTDTQEMLSVLQKEFSPQIVTLVKDPDHDPERLVSLAPFTADHIKIGNRATAYVCHNYSCQAPTTDAKQLAALLLK
jgi:uncharacterized protein YyaL (SSP411 family)